MCQQFGFAIFWGERKSAQKLLVGEILSTPLHEKTSWLSNAILFEKEKRQSGFEKMHFKGQQLLLVQLKVSYNVFL